MSTPAPNTIIDGRYKVLSRLGSGGMADVFLAEDQQLGRKVALKLLHGRFAADPDFVERFRREAQSAAGLQHPNIVSVYDRGSYDDTYYIAMEYLPGRSLKQLIRDEAPVDPVRAIDITIQILKAARFAHRRGVIHRDLKPHNVIVDDADQAKVTDFGIARAGASDMTETGSIMGTAQYLSPEQAQGHAVAQGSDLYSIGVVLYELLTGRVPFEGDAAVTIALKHVSEAPPPPSQINPRIPLALEQVVLWSLNKNPSDRPANADQLIAALENAKASILSGGGAQNTASMAAVAAGAAAGAGGAAVGALAPPEPAPYPDHTTNGAGDRNGPPTDDEGRRRWLPWLIAAVVVALIAGAATAAYFISRPKQRVVPPVTGESLNVARTVVQNAGFIVAPINVPSAKAPGTVIGENPSAGVKADEGSTVTLSVSQGPGQRTIPSVLGLGETAARKLITRAGLKVRAVAQPSQQYAVGDATGTDPKAGQAVAPGTEVTLFVSSGKPQKQVPDVTGQNQASASTELTNAGFNVRSTTQSSSTTQPGDVISQNPSGGTAVAPGSTVTIVVAAAPATGTVPPVVGDPASGAVSALTAAGFKVVRQTTNVTDKTKSGSVLSQSPPGGAKAKQHSTVTIVVGHYVPPTTSTPTTSTPTTSTPTTGSSTTSSHKP
ncbi:MAG: Stk1 family PASTA domain-containing Ser/Thr kinase [Solirubrobacteraceae bacterium]